MSKPYKGVIDNWKIVPAYNGMGYLIEGKSIGHPQYDNEIIYTSKLVSMSFDKEGKVTVETLNSQYILGEMRL